MSRSPFRLLALMAFLQSAFSAHADGHAGEFKVSCGGVFHLCGFADPSGELVVPHRFEELRPFSDQRAAVRVEGLWGYLKPDGTFAIEPIFDEVEDYQYERAEVIYKGNAGVIDLSGAFVVPAEYWRAVPFGRDAALVVMPDATRKDRARLESNFLFENFHLLDHDGRIVTEPPIVFDWFVRPGDIGPTDRIWASLDGKTFGLMDDMGNWLTEPTFHHVQTLHEDRAIVASEGPPGKRLWGAVDRDGKIVIELEHHWLSYFSNGYGLVGGPGTDQHRKIGLIRPDGSVVGNRLFDKAERPAGASPMRVMDQGIWYNFAADGTLVREEPDGTVIGSCPQGLTILRDGAGYAVTDQSGERQIEERLSHITFGLTKDGERSVESILRRDVDCSAPIVVGIAFRDDWKWSYVRTDGKPLVLGRWFTDPGGFSAGYAIVHTGPASPDDSSEMWGILNEEGEFTHPLGPVEIGRRYDMLLPGGQPYFRFGTGSDEYPADAFGHPVTVLDPTVGRRREQLIQCSGGARIVREASGFGIEGPDKATLIPSVHRAITCYQNGIAWAPKEDAKHWCPIGPEGTFRSAPACIETYYPYSMSHHYPEEFSADPFESNVLWISALLDWGFGIRDVPPKWVGDGVMAHGSSSFLEFYLP